MIVAAHSMFAMAHDDARLTVHEMDAWDFVNDPANRGTIGALQIDLYDATARGPVLDSVAFYRAARACLSEAGIAVINLFGDHPSFERNMKYLNAAFDQRVIALPKVHDGNRIAFAFSGPALAATYAQLNERAALIEDTLKLPARKWVKAFQQSVGGDAATFITIWQLAARPASPVSQAGAGRFVFAAAIARRDVSPGAHRSGFARVSAGFSGSYTRRCPKRS
ncbi:MAG: Polyamine aminopropyltransferase [Burkholderia gladioli]|nr:MAG: Polyamine aminopropyltransferase [Burkholderia gladioli]